MTKRQAYARIDKGDLTWGHLKHYVEQCFDHDRTSISTVNAGMTHGQALDILSAALVNHDDNELVISSRYTSARKARGSLLAVNVLRETHYPVGADSTDAHFKTCPRCGNDCDPSNIIDGRCGECRLHEDESEWSDEADGPLN